MSEIYNYDEKMVHVYVIGHTYPFFSHWIVIQ